MNKENKITVNNLIYSLLFLVFGIIILTNTDDLITILSKIIGTILIIIGIIKLIIYIYMKGKLGNYNITSLIIGLGFICFGSILIFLSGALSFVIGVTIGSWVLFSGINRIIFSITIKLNNNKGFFVYLLTAILMVILGVFLISGLFDEFIGAFIIIYSIIEIINYIYFKINNRNLEEINNKPVKSRKTIKNKKLKDSKMVDAIIEEE